MPPKNSKKAENAAPWWWEAAVYEKWGAEGKDRRRQKVYSEMVEALDAVYGGEGRAEVCKYAHWGNESESWPTPL
jgi:hypothetical protein